MEWAEQIVKPLNLFNPKWLLVLTNDSSTFIVLCINKTPAEQRDIFRPELFYNYISLRLKNKPMHYKNANKFEEKKTFIHRTPF